MGVTCKWGWKRVYGSISEVLYVPGMALALELDICNDLIPLSLCYPFADSNRW